MRLLNPTGRSVLGLGLVTLILVPVAYAALFAGVTPYDDEGTLLVTLAGPHEAWGTVHRLLQPLGAVLARDGGPSAPAPTRRDPLVRHIAEDFRRTVSVGPYRLLERRGA